MRRESSMRIIRDFDGLLDVSLVDYWIFMKILDKFDDRWWIVSYKSCKNIMVWNLDQLEFQENLKELPTFRGSIENSKEQGLPTLK